MPQLLPSIKNGSRVKSSVTTWEADTMSNFYLMNSLYTSLLHRPCSLHLSPTPPMQFTPLSYTAHAVRLSLSTAHTVRHSPTPPMQFVPLLHRPCSSPLCYTAHAGCSTTPRRGSHVKS